MPDLLGATNPVPGYDNSIANRSIPVSPDNTQIQNVPDPSRVVRPDGRTEQQDGGQQDFGGVRYDSNFQTFLQRLRGTPNLAQSLSRLFMGQGTVVLSGLSEGVAGELGQAIEMLQLDESELLTFLTGQMKGGTRLSGALFALLRNAYAHANDGSVQQNILNFVRSYLDYSSSSHIEGNMVRNMRGMADAMPVSWGEKLLNLMSELENSIAAGDRKGAVELLQQRVFPYMSAYVGHTHDIGTARGLLSLLTLDVARYENGSEENLLESFRRLTSYGTLKDQLGGVDDNSLLQLLKSSRQQAGSALANKFSDHLSQAAAQALRGEGSAETQEIFKQLVSAMLVNESVYMPVNHFLIPLQLDGRLLFSELWVDPDAEEEKGGARRGGGTKLLLKMDVQGLGLFDVVLTAREREVDMRIACPERVAPFSKEIERTAAGILTRNGLKPREVSVRRMERPVALTEVFPKIFEGKDSVNVKV